MGADTSAESRYAPIEGELLGLTWALQKTAHYTLGCPKLVVMVDHKPLLGLLKKGDIGAIANPRLQALAEMTMRWNFDIKHVQGKMNFGPDAFFRFLASGVESVTNCGVSVKDRLWSEELEAGVAAAVQFGKGVKVVSWELIRSTGMSDREYVSLFSQLSSGSGQWDPELKPYERFKDELSVVDGVALYEGRVVVPGLLREDVLRALQQAHKGHLVWP